MEEHLPCLDFAGLAFAGFERRTSAVARSGAAGLGELWVHVCPPLHHCGGIIFGHSWWGQIHHAALGTSLAPPDCKYPTAPGLRLSPLPGFQEPGLSQYFYQKCFSWFIQGRWDLTISSLAQCQSVTFRVIMP